MAEYYVDHGAYATNIGTTPTWGVPQEGDGSATTAATASSVASIVINAQPVATNSLTICGLILYATSGGTYTYTIGADINATVTNIVNAINGNAGFGSAAVGSGVAVGIPKVCNLMYARNTGGTTVEIMMRVGSSTLNNANNFNVAISSSGWSTPPTITQFAGGSGGCWGWLANTAALGVSNSIAINTYGLFGASLPMVAAPNTAPTTRVTPTIADPIFVRTGNGYTLTYPVNTTPLPASQGFDNQVVFDSNTRWTGDSGTGVVTISVSFTTGSQSLRMMRDGASNKMTRCIKRGSLRFLLTSATNSDLYLGVSTVSGNRYMALVDGVTFEVASGVSTSSLWHFVSFVSPSSYTGIRYKNCDFKYLNARTTWNGLLYSTNGLDGFISFEGCTITANCTGGADPGPAVTWNNGGIGSMLRVIGCSFSGWSFGRFRPIATPTTFTNGAEIYFEGNTGLILSTYTGCSAYDSITPYTASYTYTSADAGLGFRHEWKAGVVDWNPDAAPAYPTRNARLLDGSTPWSIKMDWFASTLGPVSHLTTPRLGAVSRLANGVRTLALDFLTPVAVNPLQVVMRVHYIGTDNLAKSDSTYGLTAALTQPGATWTGSGSYPSHVSNRLTLTTSSAVKLGTEVAVFLEVFGVPPGGSGVQLYVDPEVTMT